MSFELARPSHARRQLQLETRSLERFEMHVFVLGLATTCGRVKSID